MSSTVCLTTITLMFPAGSYTGVRHMIRASRMTTHVENVGEVVLGDHGMGGSDAFASVNTVHWSVPEMTALEPSPITVVAWMSRGRTNCAGLWCQ